MTLTPLILAADDMSLGRLDPTLLSDQARMEMTFENVENKTGIIDSAGNYLDISAWDILELCPEGRVWKIRSSLREGEPGALRDSSTLHFFQISLVAYVWITTICSGRLGRVICQLRLKCFSSVEITSRGHWTLQRYLEGCCLSR